MSKISTVIVVAAGIGSRLKPFTDKHPKMLTNLGNSRIFDYVISCIEILNPDKIIFVLGYMYQDIISAINKTKLKNKIDIVFNYNYQNSGCFDSLMKCQYIDSGRVAYFNSDLIFYPKLLSDTVKINNENLIFTRQLKTIGVGETILQKAIVKNNIITKMDLTLEGNFTHEVIGPVIMSSDVFEDLRRLYMSDDKNTIRDNRCYSAIGKLLGNHKFLSIEIKDKFWYEINTVHDLNNAKENMEWS